MMPPLDARATVEWLARVAGCCSVATQHHRTDHSVTALVMASLDTLHAHL
jgi:hypothetical protein